jgi:hypothetical protein
MTANHHKYSGILIVALLLFAGGHSDAASWRINNNANRKAHFTDINAAMSSSKVQEGDTLYLDPGCTLTSNQTVSKRVTIIGTGYSLESGTHDVAAINAQLYIKAPGTKIESVAVTITGTDKTWYVQAANVTIERCHNHFISIEAQYANIRQCRGFHYFGKGKDSMTSAYCTIENCMLGTNTAVNIYDLCLATIRNNYLWTESTSDSYKGLLNNLSKCTIVNNIIVGSQKPNNMFTPDNLTDCIVRNNIMTCAEGTYPGYPDNICLGSNTTAEVFTVKLDNRTLSDKLFLPVKDLEQAKGYANDGGDCGPFGGTYPYILSGYPFGMPHFKSSSADFRATDGKVSFSNEVTIQTK